MPDRSQSAPLPADRPWPSLREAARAISLGLSIAILIVVVALPYAFRSEDPTLATAVVPVMLLGVIGGLVHAFGYRPRSPVLKTMFGPWAAWPLMLSSLVFLTFGMSA